MGNASVLHPGASPNDAHDSHHKGYTLNFAPSIFDQALLTPLIRGQHKTGLSYACLMMSLVTVLLINVGIQLVVMDKIIDLREQSRQSLEYKLFGEPGEVGMCLRRPYGEIPVVNKLRNQPSLDEVLDCTSSSITVLSNMSQLDIDGDGEWTESEATQLGDIWEEKYKKNSVLDQLHRHLLSLAHAGQLVAQRNHTSAAAAAMTTIPVSWLQLEQEKLLLCAAVQPGLCSNLEFRGILEPLAAHVFAEEDSHTPTDRISACKGVLSSYCPQAFGQLFKYYANFGADTCGAPMYTWNDTLQLMTTEYAEWVAYVGGPRSKRDAVVSSFFQVFLYLILLVWWMIMLSELRQLWAWIMVLSFIPSTNDREGARPDEHVQGYDPHHAEEPIYIHSVPTKWKIFVYVFHLVPRGYIWLRLSYFGTWFLIAADSYTDLILNSVALAFLVEVDNLLYDAVMAKRDKDVHDKVQPVIIVDDCFAALYQIRHKLPMHLFFLFILMGLASYFTSQGFLAEKPMGKVWISNALNCVCQLEGHNCIGAQMFGGNVSVREASGILEPAVPPVYNDFDLWLRLKDSATPDFTHIFTQ